MHHHRSFSVRARSKSPCPPRIVTSDPLETATQSGRRLSLAPPTPMVSTTSSACSTPLKRKGSKRLAAFLRSLGSDHDSNNLHITPTSPSRHKMAPTLKYKLVVLGGPRTGKTQIIQKFLYNTFEEKHAATVEQLYSQEYQIKGLGSVAVDVLDTSGSFEFPAMKRLAISGGQAFVLVYAIDDKESFEEVIRLRDLVNEIKNPEGKSEGNTSGNPPIVIVANKSDLDDTRVVAKEMAECESIDWDVAFVECSARNGDNIVSIFHQLLLQAHFKGIFKGLSPDVSSQTLVVEPRRERRRSSLPVNDLFHRTSAKQRSTSPCPRRDSCALS